MKEETCSRGAHRLDVSDIPRVLDGTVHRRRVSTAYLLGMFVVAGAMIVLPLIYLGMIFAIGYGMYFHAIRDADLLSGGTGGPWRLILYLLPFLGGTVLIVFLLKPLLARNKFKATELVIDTNNEPLLPAYVARLCQLMGAPAPNEIKVDCTINASAGLRFGVLRRGLTLTIGMPLVAHLTLREFTGVLAHEFGHFTQRIAMRLSYLIRSIEAWFHRVVYERDEWDEKLIRASKSDDSIHIIFMCLRLMIWFTRGILWLLMMIGDAIACFLLRQMEYEADYYAATVTGTKAFATMAHKVDRLGVAARVSYSQLASSWRNQHLADNLPALISRAAVDMPRKAEKALADHVAKERTRLFHTHPAIRSRIQRVDKLACGGIVHLDGPASKLFHNFETIAKAATLIHYRELIDERISADNLIDTNRMLRERAIREREMASVRDYFGHRISISRPVFFDQAHIDGTTNPAKTLKTLKQIHQKIYDALPRVVEAYREHDAADDGLCAAGQASVLCRAKIKFDPAQYKVEAATLDAIDRARNHCKARQHRAGEILLTYEKVLRLRLKCAFQLLKTPEVKRAIKESQQLFDEGTKIIAMLSRLRDAFAHLDEQRASLAALAIALEALEHDRENAVLVGLLHERLGDTLTHVQSSKAELRDVIYPFEHARGRISVSDYLIDRIPVEASFGDFLDLITLFQDNLAALYERALSRLAAIAIRVEQVAKLPSLRERVPEEEVEDEGEGARPAERGNPKSRRQ